MFGVRHHVKQFYRQVSTRPLKESSSHIKTFVNGIHPDKTNPYLDMLGENVVGASNRSIEAINMRINGINQTVIRTPLPGSVPIYELQKTASSIASFDTSVSDRQWSLAASYFKSTDVQTVQRFIDSHHEDCVVAAESDIQSMVKRGGGLQRGSSPFSVKQINDDIVAVHTTVDVCESMGARVQNKVARDLGTFISAQLGIVFFAGILSNAYPKRLVSVSTITERRPVCMSFCDIYTVVLRALSEISIVTSQDHRAVSVAWDAYVWQKKNVNNILKTTFNKDTNKLLLQLPLPIGLKGRANQFPATRQLANKLYSLNNHRDFQASVASYVLLNCIHHQWHRVQSHQNKIVDMKYQHHTQLSKIVPSLRKLTIQQRVNALTDITGINVKEYIDQSYGQHTRPLSAVVNTILDGKWIPATLSETEEVSVVAADAYCNAKITPHVQTKCIDLDVDACMFLCEAWIVIPNGVLTNEYGDHSQHIQNIKDLAQIACDDPTRKPTADKGFLNGFMAQAETMGYDTASLVSTLLFHADKPLFQTRLNQNGGFEVFSKGVFRYDALKHDPRRNIDRLSRRLVGEESVPIDHLRLMMAMGLKSALVAHYVVPQGIENAHGRLADEQTIRLNNNDK
jgi:hydroxymethylglutaryl-CoA reductase